MKPFHDDFMAKWDSKFVAPMEQSLGMQVSDYLPLLQGQLTLAITQNGWDGSDGDSARDAVAARREGQKRFAGDQPGRAETKMERFRPDRCGP